MRVGMTTVGVMVALLGAPAGAQPAPSAPAAVAAPAPPPAAVAAPAPPPANPADVATPEAIVQAAYNVISGPAGQARDWNRLRSIMLPDARFIPTHAMLDGSVRHRAVAVDQYISGADKAFATQGFYERGVILSVQRTPHTANVLSPYESRHTQGEAPFARGVNQFQLFNDGRRWWIVSIFWEDESPQAPLAPEAAAALARVGR